VKESRNFLDHSRARKTHRTKTHTTRISARRGLPSTAIAGQHSVQFCLCSIPRSSPFLTEVHSINESLHNVGVNCGWQCIFLTTLPQRIDTAPSFSQSSFASYWILGLCHVLSMSAPSQALMVSWKLDPILTSVDVITAGMRLSRWSVV
jgi:hypothetical protein